MAWPCVRASCRRSCANSCRRRARPPDLRRGGLSSWGRLAAWRTARVKGAAVDLERGRPRRRPNTDRDAAAIARASSAAVRSPSFARPDAGDLHACICSSADERCSRPCDTDRRRVGRTDGPTTGLGRQRGAHTHPRCGARESLPTLILVGQPREDVCPEFSQSPPRVVRRRPRSPSAEDASAQDPPSGTVGVVVARSVGRAGESAPRAVRREVVAGSLSGPGSGALTSRSHSPWHEAPTGGTGRTLGGL
jgi:hypothetical protein